MSEVPLHRGTSLMRNRAHLEPSVVGLGPRGILEGWVSSCERLTPVGAPEVDGPAPGRDICKKTHPPRTLP